MRGCEAQPRPQFRNTGWTCRGQGLTVLLRVHRIPCVLPDAMVSDALAEPWGKAYDSPVPFAGGDHYHLCAPAVWLHA